MTEFDNLVALVTGGASGIGCRCRLRYWSSAERTLRYWIVQSKAFPTMCSVSCVTLSIRTKSTPPSL